MDDLAQAFRAESAALGLGARGARYPASLRELACRYWQQNCLDRSIAGIAADLGVSIGTLQRWTAREKSPTPRAAESTKGPTIREVSIRPDDEPRRVSSTFTGLTLSTPTGLLVQGLTVHDVIVLVRALG